MLENKVLFSIILVLDFVQIVLSQESITAVEQVQELSKEDSEAKLQDLTKVGQTLTTLLTSINTCSSLNDGWSDPYLGDFSKSQDSPYCSQNCSRNFYCCVPETPEKMDVRFLFFTRKERKTIGGFVTSVDQGLYNYIHSTKNKKIVWIVHGFLNDIRLDPVWNNTAKAYLDRGYDVFLVDWSKGNRLYLQSIANVRVVGALIGRMMLRLRVTDRSLCSGFSLGAQVCGETGKFLRKKGQTLAKCHGIDPAGPAYDGCDSRVHLDPSDCGVVVSIHTSIFNGILSLVTQGFGTSRKVGHCDFWMEDAAENDKDCDQLDILGDATRKLLKGSIVEAGDTLSDLLTCRHSLAMRWYLNQIRSKCMFIGWEASCSGNEPCIREEIKAGTVKPHLTGYLPSPIVMVIPPDDHCSSRYQVDYSVAADDTPPFC
jgi:hypothetical protein